MGALLARSLSSSLACSAPSLPFSLNKWTLTNWINNFSCVVIGAAKIVFHRRKRETRPSELNYSFFVGGSLARFELWPARARSLLAVNELQSFPSNLSTHAEWFRIRGVQWAHWMPMSSAWMINLFELTPVEMQMQPLTLRRSYRLRARANADSVWIRLSEWQRCTYEFNWAVRNVITTKQGFDVENTQEQKQGFNPQLIALKFACQLLNYMHELCL